jgi:virginiamycin B lyase
MSSSSKGRSVGLLMCAMLCAGSMLWGQETTLFEVPDGTPGMIVAGPDNDLFFTVTGHAKAFGAGTPDRIGRMTTDGAYQAFDIPTLDDWNQVFGFSISGQYYASGLTLGADGNLWVALTKTNRIGKLDLTTGTVTEYPISTENSRPLRICLGPDNALWFTEYRGNKIARIRSNGSISEFPLPPGFERPVDIAPGPDGRLWFTAEGSRNVGAITTNGVVSEVASGFFRGVAAIGASHEGPMWTTFLYGGVVEIAANGVAREVLFEDGASTVGKIITPGPDRAMWTFQESVGLAQIITETRDVAIFPVPPEIGGVLGLAAGPDQRLWFAGDGGLAAMAIEIPDFGPTQHYIPASGAGPGSGNSLWSTDVVVNNAGEQAFSYEVRYLERNEDNSAPAVAGPFELEPGTSALYQDILPGLFEVQAGSGALRFDVDDGAEALFMSRTKNTDADGATFGQGIPSVSGEALIPFGRKVRLIQLAENEALRTNVGFMNGTGQNIAVSVEFFTGGGTSLGEDSLFLRPYSYQQWNQAFNRVSQAGIDNGYADVWTTTDGGTFTTYGSVVDNLKGDPTYVLPQPLDIWNASRVYIPASGAGPGAGDSLWSTDVVMNNPGANTVNFEVHYLRKGQNNTDPLVAGPYSLLPGVSVLYEDILPLLFGVTSGSGALRFELAEPAPVLLMSRTKNTDADGATFGQGIPALDDRLFIAHNRKVRLVQLAENDALRTNIGFLNGSPGGINLNVEYFDGDGQSLGTESLYLPPYSYNQWNQAFRRVTDDDVDNGYAEIWTDSAGGFFTTYASVVDKPQ